MHACEADFTCIEGVATNAYTALALEQLGMLT